MLGNITGGYNPLHHYNYIQNLGQRTGTDMGKAAIAQSVEGKAQSPVSVGVKVSLSGNPDGRVLMLGEDGKKSHIFHEEKEDIPLPWEMEGQKVTLPGQEEDKIKLPGQENGEVKLPGQEEEDKTLQGEECETCKNRKYQDGSDENVSFKSAQHISPESAAARVRAHEGEHVANAYSKAMKEDGKVLRASVSIHTDICDECGKVYVSGGTTHTTIKYSGEEAEKPEDAKNTREIRE